MSPLISRATDNLGLIFSLQLGGAGGPVPVQDFFYDIELFGEGISDVSFRVGDRVEGEVDLPTQTVSGSGGGYTKLNMKSLTSSEISLEPQLYTGGFRDNRFSVVTRSDGLVTSSYSGDFINDRDGVVTASTSRLVDVGDTTTVINGAVISSGGDAAAFSIDGEWMGIAGGGTFSYVIYDSKTRNRDTGEGTRQFQEENSLTIIQAIDPNPLNSGGYGGANRDDPTASPSSGENQTLGTYSRERADFTSPLDGPDFSTIATYGGAGGGGAPGGNAADPSISQASTGGKGNIRIYADNNGIGPGAFSGPIASVPGTEMNLESFNIGSEFNQSKVRLTATNTGLGITYTDNKVESLRELKALLDPELEFAFDIELYGEGLGDLGLSNSGAVSDPGLFPIGPVPADSLKGGYTKLRMIVPSSASSISFLPKTYSGGVNTITGSQFGGGATSYSFVSDSTKGGDAAAFSIDGEWMGVAGGSGVVRYESDIIIRTGASGFEPKQEITILSIPTVPGRGGVNAANPTASPGRGGDVLSENNPVTIFTDSQFATQIFGGTGGGGAGGGPADTGVAAAEGGGGNIRVYAETNGASDDGNIILPGIDPIYMRLVNSRDNFWLGASKVVVSHPVTGASLEFTSDTTISIRELRALLIPTQEIAFEVELFGAGLGVLPRVSGGTNEFRPAPLPSSNTTTFTDVDSLAGGYTKLKMFVPVSDANTISFEPALYLGGKQDSGSTSPGNAGGQNASAFSINGEWMGIAGGGGDGRYSYTITRDISSTLDSSVYSNFSFNNATVPGKGGVNVGNPTASPQNGGDYRYTFITTSQGGGRQVSQGSLGGSGGGGALGGIGRGASPLGPGDGGEGNIRIYAETDGGQTKGDLNSVPGVYMELLDSADDFWVGNSKVVIKNILNGDIATFNTNRTYTTKELREIFYPGVFPPA